MHAPSFSVFSNWPTSSTPLHSVSSVAFSGNGMLLLPLSLMRHLTVFDREICGGGQRQGQGTSLQIEALQHVMMQRKRSLKQRSH